MNRKEEHYFQVAVHKYLAYMGIYHFSVPKEFCDWAIANGYNENLTIDRIDVNGNYCPENCRWISMKEQSRNKRNTKYVFYNNKKIPLVSLCEELNVNYDKIRSRIKIGWSIDEAINGKRA